MVGMELAEVTEMVVEHEATLGRHDERLDNLEEHRKRQNGSLDRMAEDVKALRDKFTAILAGTVVSLIMLVINLIVTMAGRR